MFCLIARQANVSMKHTAAAQSDRCYHPTIKSSTSSSSLNSFRTGVVVQFRRLEPGENFFRLTCDLCFTSATK